MNNDIKSGYITSFLNSRYHTQIQSIDIHYIIQTNKENTHFLNETKLSISESQRLLNTINEHNDHYHVKYRNDNTQMMNCIFY